MKIIHSYENEIIVRNTTKDCSLMLTNKAGGYLLLSDYPKSRYEGLFVNIDNKMYRIIEDLSVGDVSEIIPPNKIRGLEAHSITRSSMISEHVKNHLTKGGTSKICPSLQRAVFNEAAGQMALENNFFCFKRRKYRVSETFFTPYNHNSLVYELNRKSRINIILDVKESYDNRVFGRFYEISQEKGCLIVKFTKKTDDREDESNGVIEYSLFIAIKSDDMGYEKLMKWIERDYRDDQKRNSPPFSRFVFHALALTGKTFVFSISNKKEEAIKEAAYIFNNITKLKIRQKIHFLKNILKEKKDTIGKIKDNELKFAYICALNSLESLSIKHNDEIGILAGLPWFFQFWPRDELISLKSITHVYLKNRILLKYLNEISANGGLPNISNKNNADAIGWLFKRIEEFLINKGSSHSIERYGEEFIKKRLEYSCEKLLSHLQGDFVVNNPKETWMDSISREGARIEIQALFLNMLNLAYILTKDVAYKNHEEKLKQKIKEQFWNGNTIADGIGDWTIRPNLFIAAYVYPDMLKQEEWTICFKETLNHLWLPWGGLSTIDQNHPDFNKFSTGENPNSYHNGDSWFWVNNLAALVMARTNKDAFEKQINAIMQSSKEEILYSGAIGCHAELSSAAELRSQGCLNQAWSNAMFVELVEEIVK